MATGQTIEKEFGIPIVNKRVSVTPISLVASASDTADYAPFALSLIHIFCGSATTAFGPKCIPVQQEGRPAQQHRDTLWTESGGCAAAEGGGQRVGPCPHAPGKAEVQRHALVDTVHPQGIEQGGQELKQDQQGEKESPLDGLSRKQEQTAGAQQHGQDQQGGELPQGCLLYTSRCV